ncbi:DUF559 domain-containing protein [Klebsiella pneumoniae]|nr:DUF559 domain-containing protein [Klebsiella pneumoniae]
MAFKTWLPITRTVRNAGQPCRPVARLCITLPSDRRVQKNLTTTGWRVLRFWNIEFEEYGDAVMEGILEAPESPMPSPLPSD